MKTFREFLNEDAIKAQKAWQDWMKANPQEFGKGGRFYEKGSNTKVSQASKDFMKHYMKTGKPPEGFEIKQTRVPNPSRATQQPSRQEPPKATQTPPKQPKATQQPPRQEPPKATQTPPKQPSGGGGAKPPSTSPLSTTPKPATPKGPGLRARLGKLAGPASSVASGALEYKARRDAGESRARAAGGAVASGAGWAKGAQMGASLAARLPIPPSPAKAATIGAGAIAGGLVGDTAASAAYDYAANKTRPARQAVSKATGFNKFQQKNALIKPGSGLSGIERAQQTVNTRGARQVASKAGTYGATKGSALSGIGGRTVVSKDKKGSAFMSTGAGSQRKTVQLAKTQLVRDPKTGQQRVGDLAFKGGKAVYLARPSVSSRDTSLAARVGRALNIGRYSKSAEQQAAKQEYRTALRNTQTYQKKLGITPKQAKSQKLPGR